MKVWLVVLAVTFTSLSLQGESDLAALKAKAIAGDAHSQVELGIAYSTGRDVALNDREAVRWFRMAAEKGDASAEYLLGERYALGRGVHKSLSTSARWMEQSAAQGDPRALSNLGAMYLNGLGVKQDDKKAFQLTQEAAENGFAMAEFGLGSMYANGRGAASDLSESARWYTKAADQGNVPAMNNLAWLLTNSAEKNIRNVEVGLRWANRAVAETKEKEADYLDTLAGAFSENNQIQDALDAELKAWALDPDNESYSASVRIFRDDLAYVFPPKGTPDKLDSRNEVSAPKAVYSPRPGPGEAFGKVMLQATVNENGRVGSVEVVNSLNPNIDSRAIQAVRQWRFQPARRNGLPVAITIHVELSFSN